LASDPRAAGRLIALLALSVNLMSCVATASHTLEYLDEETAATVTSVVSPLVFARSRRELAAGARDYATVVATTVNRAGRLEHLILIYFWSTVDPRVGNGTDRPKGEPELIADDRVVRLTRDPRTARQAGISRKIHAPAGSDPVASVYRSDLETLRFIADAGRLRLQIAGPVGSPSYELWTDGRSQLRAFVAAVGR
jgi:hypothetical protein